MEAIERLVQACVVYGAYLVGIGLMGHLIWGNIHVGTINVFGAFLLAGAIGIGVVPILAGLYVLLRRRS